MARTSKAHFTPSGVWLKTEREVKAFHGNRVNGRQAYATWKVKDIEEHELPGGVLEYRLEVRNGDKKANISSLTAGCLR